eukprot:Skav217104  [mRNA]  locus=scaffold139:119576:126011:+ [translate_table: standard]
MLEPRRADIGDGSVIDIVGVVIIYDPTGMRHLLKSAVHGCFFTAAIQGNVARAKGYTLLSAQVTMTGNRLHVLATHSNVLVHQQPDYDKLSSVMETCTGMGFLGQGLISAGMDVKVQNELRQPFCDHLRLHAGTSVIQGDIGDPETLKSMFAAHPHGATLAAGFSCQPWSRLGDGKGAGDERAATLPNVLKAAHLLQSHSLILECVVAAGCDKWVKEQIGAFCQQIGFHMAEQTLQLRALLPAIRERWWCILRAPIFPRTWIPALPCLSTPPVISDMLPAFPTRSESDQKQLKLDQYESRRFHEHNGIHTNLLCVDRPMKTALHGWANQLSGCPCTCRDFALSESRLAAKGLFGALVLTGGNFTIFSEQVPCTRHAHPSEMAALHGVDPNQPWPDVLRLAIAGLGQMASPIQSCWLAGFFMEDIALLRGIKTVTPEAGLWSHFERVINGVQAVFPGTLGFDSVVQYVTRVADVLQASQVARYPNIHPLPFMHPAIASVAQQPQKLVLADEPITPTEIVPTDDELPPSEHPTGPQVTQVHEVSGQSEVDQVHADAADPMTSPRSLPTKRKTVDQCVLVDGGIPAFANAVMPANTESEILSTQTLKNALDAEEPAEVAPAATVSTDAAPAAMNSDAADGLHTVVITHEAHPGAIFVRVPNGTTVGEIYGAEYKLDSEKMQAEHIKAVDLVGGVLLSNSPTHDMQQIHFALHGPEVFTNHVPARLMSPGTKTRLEVLQIQGSWVANDEMDFYLSMFVGMGVATAHPSCVIGDGIEPAELKTDLTTWMTQCLYGSQTSRCSISALIVEGHWFPIMVTQTAMQVLVTTTQEGVAWVNAAIPDGVTVATREIPLPITATRGDFCGFQVVAWLNALLHRDRMEEDLSVPPLKHAEAVHWRTVFYHQIIQNGVALRSISPGDIAFGGGGDVTEMLQQLLTEHGVPPEALKQRTEHVLSSLGRAQITQVLRGPKPWRDLKHLANQASPKVQLVLAQELSTMIQQQAPAKKFGDKRQKKNSSAKPLLRLTPSDVVIPEGVFRDNSGHLVNQITIEQIHPNATGVVLATMQEALPYIRAPQKVSKAALAMIILDCTDAMSQAVGQALRLPAKCVHTQEPVLVTGRIVQIGEGLIERHTPANTIRVDEVPNSVIRAILFRDEIDFSWDKVTSRPVKEVIRMVPALAEAASSTGLLDWKNGLYLEPREEDGRRPSQKFRVIWLPRFDHQESTVALRTTNQWACLVRSSNRYGLRVRAEHAQEVHQQHKNTPYIDSSGATLFIGGPFPWGATRSTLNKLFQQWKWEARPLQPKGRSIDGKGLLWEIQASREPQFSVYALEHADILIAAAPQKSKQPTVSHQEIQGSARTMQALQQQQRPPKETTEDPLQVNDPWKHKQPKVWTWLKRSPAPVKQKLRVIQAVAWPKCLYGISSVRVGPDHFAKLRAAAMNALGWNKKGASSHIQFAMVQQCKFDPEAVAVWESIKAFRAYADPAVAFPLMDELAQAPPKRYAPGPCSTLMERLHSLQWRWLGDGYVEDHWACQWNLVDSPIQHVSARFAQAWTLRAGQTMSSRDTFQGLERVDRAFTMQHQRKWSDDQAAFLRTCLNGTFYTRDKQIHSGKIASPNCPWCGHHDSLHHRIWERPHFADLRDTISPDAKRTILAQPPCTYLHGWFVEMPEVVRFTQELRKVPPEPTFESFAHLPSPLQLFVDGACQMPTEPALRLASWGIVVANLHHDTFEPVSAGVLPGPMHTSLRAEVFAAAIALEAAMTQGKTVMLWTDNQLVFDRITGWLNGKGKILGMMAKDRDLWLRLCRAVKQARARGSLLHVLKVGSRAVADASVRQRDELAAQLEAEAPRRGRELEVSGLPLPDSVEDIPCPTLEPYKAQVFEWLKGITNPQAAHGSWVCGYQLLAHFQRTTGLLGFQYRRPKYILIHRPDQHTFARLAAGFLSMLKALLRFLEVPLVVEMHVPTGCSFRMWQRCVLLWVHGSVVDDVDAMFQPLAPIIKTKGSFDNWDHYLSAP